MPVNGQRLQDFDKFIYLGNALSKAVRIGDVITARNAKASVVFNRRCGNV